MSKPAAFSIFKAFACAGRGVALLARGRNGRLQFGVAALAIACGFVFRLAADEWLAITLSVALVLSMEAMNTALERAVDIASPGWSALARDAKDLAAGAVLIASAGSMAVGLIIFIPRIVSSL